jgi:hypothetical protein
MGRNFKFQAGVLTEIWGLKILYVTALEILGLSLFGTLTPNLADLHFLSNPSVADLLPTNSPAHPLLSLCPAPPQPLNVFVGTLPSQLSLLKNLQVLNLHNNKTRG